MCIIYVTLITVTKDFKNLSLYLLDTIWDLVLSFHFFSTDCYCFGYTVYSRIPNQQVYEWFSYLCLLSIHKRTVIIGIHYHICLLLWVPKVELRTLDFCDERHYTLSHLMDPSLNILIRIIYEINCGLDRKSHINSHCLHYL